MVQKNKRQSLTMRFQPRDDTPLGKVVKWLNSLPKEERRQKITDVCMMTLLPYALEAAGESPTVVERCYWDVQERLFQYTYCMKQFLSIDSEPPLSGYLKQFVLNGSSILENSVSSSHEETEAEKDYEDYVDMDMDSMFGL